MNYDEMPAGKELNELVARKIMRVTGHFWLRYSQDISAAWEVVEKIIAMSYTVLVSNGKHSPQSQKWHCIITIIPQQGGYRDGYADTAPLAICRAALKAVEG